MNRPNMPRPLRLGNRAESEAPFSRAPSPAPSVMSTGQDLPPFQSDNLQVPIARLAHQMDSMLTPERTSTTPPFRLLPPSTQGSVIDGHERTAAWAQSRRGSPAMPPAPSISEAPSPGPMLHGIDNRSNLVGELRARPLTESYYGRQIVSLLTEQWVEAPSGLVCVVFPSNEGMYNQVVELAHMINALVCGTEAFAHPAGGVLALYSIHQLNRLLTRSGISPIVPQPAPANWAPLAARKPPDFLLESWQMRGSPRPPGSPQ